MLYLPRELYNSTEIGSLFNKNGLVFINVPRSAPFGSIREILKVHEFGKKMKGDLWKTEPIKLREKILDGTLDSKETGQTHHMTFQINLRRTSAETNRDQMFS